MNGPHFVLPVESIPDNDPVKWGGCTRALCRHSADRPRLWGQLKSMILPMRRPPAAHDVVIGRIREIRKHTQLELVDGTKSMMFHGDVVIGAFGFRYAVAQYEGIVPPLQSTYDMLSQAGVMGQVVSAASHMDEPTVIEPLGYLADEQGEPTSLRSFALAPAPLEARIPIIIVVGSGMDSGKTTVASFLTRGLTLAGKRIHAGKITGTSCIKDLHRMYDAGALKVHDFTDVGFASTAEASAAELRQVADTLISNLSLGRPDYIVLEIADGIIQRETTMLLDMLVAENRCDFVVLAVGDQLAAPGCLSMLRETWNLNVTAISGLATRSPLGTRELESLTDLPCLPLDQLASTAVLALFSPALSTIPVAKKAG